MPDVIGIDHIYIAVSDIDRSESFYDRVLVEALGFRKKRFALGGEPHVHYFNRHFGYVLRPARHAVPHDAYAPGLHHFCLRVDSADDVAATAGRLRALGIAASPAEQRPEYAPDYWATYFSDPDGIRLEVTNYRQERRERHDRWPAAEGGNGEAISGACGCETGAKRHVDTITPATMFAPIGPYSHLTRAGPFIMISGTPGVDPASAQMAGPDAYRQARQIVRNFRRMLAEVGAELTDVMHVNVFLKRVEDFAEMNRGYAEEFGEHLPARTVICVADLPKAGALMTMNLTAVATA